MPATVAIVGRPNVGKSTLFNRLVGKRLALVDSRPGVTRDRREGRVGLARTPFTLIDTAGLEAANGGALEQAMAEQTETAIEHSDLALLVIDGRAGVGPLDRHLAALIRRRGAPVIAVVNKAEGTAYEPAFAESYELGFGEPVAISAQHGDGITDLLDAIAAALDGLDLAADGAAAESEDSGARPMRLAIVGRPNVGKSTLLNRLLGDRRALTGPEPGITRDAIAVDWRYRGRALQLVDTAGMRRRARVTDRLERLAADDSLRAIRFAHVAVLMIDATFPAEHQDQAIADHIVTEGRALVVCANKWDLVADKGAAENAIADRVARAIPQLRGVAVVPCSARTGAGIDRLMAAVFAAYGLWNRRLSTGPLNRWLETAVARHPPPLAGGRQIKLRYLSQVGTRPPRFALFVNRPAALPESYRRYLINDLCERFEIPGTPIRLLLRAGKNPYLKR